MVFYVTDNREIFEEIYSSREAKGLYSKPADILGSHIRGRRIRLAMKVMKKELPVLDGLNCLLVCGGTGDLGRVLIDMGVKKVTVSDVSETALKIAKELEPRLETKVLDTEILDLPDGSYDLVMVQDGLHHLARPPLGLTEMLRVARRAVVVLEPVTGLVAGLFGKDYERLGGHVANYVFRWNRLMFSQVVKSYLLDRPHRVIFRRIWHHNVILERLARIFGKGRMAVLLSRILELLPAVLFPFGGNQMIGIVLLKSSISVQK